MNVRSGCAIGGGGLSAVARVGAIVMVIVQVVAVWTGGGGKSAGGLGIVATVGTIVERSSGGITIGGKSIGNPPDLPVSKL